MFIRHIEHVAAGRCNLLEHLGHVYLPIFWQFFDLLDRFLEDFDHGANIYSVALLAALDSAASPLA